MKKILTAAFCAAMASPALAQGWPTGYESVMLQGFYWDSYSDSQWKNLEKQAPELGSYFSLLWVPQSGKCLEEHNVMGYTPYYYFDQNSSFGSEAELRSMIGAMRQNGVGVLADVVINHHNTSGWFSFPKEEYRGTTYQLQSSDITADDDQGKTAAEAQRQGISLGSHKDEGEDWDGMRDLDHQSPNVQRVIKAYEQYLVEDITGGGSQDLILMSTLEDGGVQIELLTVDRDGMFQQVAVMGLSADKFSGCAAVAAGLGADGKRYLVLDGWTGLSGNNLATVLLYFDEESQQMLPAEQISTSELYNASLRNVSTLVSRDLDGDGIVEIPTQPDEAGLLNMSQSRRMDFIVWMDYTSPEPEKSFGLLDEESSCYIELPAEWEGNLMLTDSAEGEEAVELRTVDEGKLVLTMRLVPSSESAAGWTRLGVVASRQMQAKLAPDVEIRDKNYRLSKALYLLN